MRKEIKELKKKQISQTAEYFLGLIGMGVAAELPYEEQVKSMKDALEDTPESLFDYLHLASMVNKEISLAMKRREDVDITLPEWKQEERNAARFTAVSQKCFCTCNQWESC